MTTLTLTPAQAIQSARKEGVIEVSPGVYLNSLESILADTRNYCELTDSYGTNLYDFKNELVDFKQAPFWLTTDDLHVTPIYGEDDEDLIATLANA